MWCLCSLLLMHTFAAVWLWVPAHTRTSPPPLSLWLAVLVVSLTYMSLSFSLVKEICTWLDSLMGGAWDGRGVGKGEGNS